MSSNWAPKFIRPHLKKAFFPRMPTQCLRPWLSVPVSSWWERSSPERATRLRSLPSEHLWKDGVDVNLVIVGPQGWKVETLVEKLNTDPERGRRLFWLGRISDAYLNKLYVVSAALIAASQGEGFGLPIVEASLHGKPVIASDIPVFREIAGAMASVLFFPMGSAEALSDTVRTWLDRKTEFGKNASEGGRWISWAESAAQLSRAVVGTMGRDEARISGHGESVDSSSGGDHLSGLKRDCLIDRTAWKV